MSPGAEALPGTLSLGPVLLRVDSLDRAQGWLERVLGLHALPPGATGQTRFGTAAGGSLVELRAQPGLRRVPPRGLLGLYHYAILLPSAGDLGRFLLHLRDLGEPFGSSDHLFSEALYLTDPDGITVEVYADRPRAGWLYRGSDIVGTLDPLDAEVLIRAAGTTRWNGVPAGTRMGHLHFNTGDLSAAEHFYVHGLGFEVSTRLFPGALFVSAGRYHHHVGLNVWAAGNPPAGRLDAGLDEWTFHLPGTADLDRLAARLGAAGIEYRRDGAAVVATDPWNLTVRASEA